MILQGFLFCVAIAFCVVWYFKKSKRPSAAPTGLLLGWSLLIAFYSLLIGLLSFGATDFSGNPITLKEQLMGIVTLVGGVGQATVMMVLIRKTPSPVLLMALISCSLLVITPFIVAGGLEGLLFAVPFNINVLFVTLYALYVLHKKV